VTADSGQRHSGLDLVRACDQGIGIGDLLFTIRERVVRFGAPRGRHIARDCARRHLWRLQSDEAFDLHGYVVVRKAGHLMAEWKEPKRLQYRTHNNGRVAEVYLQHDGRFYAREALATSDVARSIGFRDNVDTLKLARRLADQRAHPNCDGSCPPWCDDSEAISDPDCRTVLGLPPQQLSNEP